MNATLSAATTITVPFFDVDVMRIVWHGHYVKYFELARCVLLDKIDYNYTQMEASGFGWPVVDIRIKYVQSARFGQVLRVRAQLAETENRLKITYVIEDEASGKRIATGYSIQVAVQLPERELCFVTPEIFRDKVNTAIEREQQQPRAE